MKTASKIVGIVNITRDSFSDGGQFLTAEDALEHARRLAGAGANFVEFGPASSNPDAATVSAVEQIERLEPVLRAFAKDTGTPDGVRVSVDATDPSVLRFAMEAGVAMLNDIRGFPDRSTQEWLADCSASLVVVHSLAGGERAARDDASVSEVIASIDRFFESRLAELVRAGISEDRLIVDPGMGFFLGRNPNASIAALQRIPELKSRFGRPVFISVSRKSFLRAITNRRVDEVGAATLAAEIHAARSGADYLRTHDVVALADALAVEAALERDDTNHDTTTKPTSELR